MLRLAVFTIAVVAAALPRPALAIPVFAHRYGLTCGVCHTAIPHLTAFGERFLANGYRLPMKPRGVFPVAVKLNLAATSDPATTDAGAPLPKAVVDEIEVLAGGSAGPRTSYFSEVYVVDGGVPGRTRDLWAAQRLGRLDAEQRWTLRLGQFGLDLPVDPETFRESPDHYAVFDQTVGENPFRFFAPRIGGALEWSDERGTRASLAVVQGHDPGSGIASSGADRALALARAAGRFNAAIYRYDGTRPIGGALDRFWRHGYGLGYEAGRFRLDAVLQRGNDSAADGIAPQGSSGGFLQARYAFAPALFALARYDGTQDTTFARALTAGIGVRPARNARLTMFDTVRRGDRGERHHTLNTQLLVAY